MKDSRSGTKDWVPQMEPRAAEWDLTSTKDLRSLEVGRPTWHASKATEARASSARIPHLAIPESLAV